MNKIILIGNLTKDPELTSTNSGVSVCKFTIAVQRKFKNADVEREADFINCVAWRELAEHISKYLKKGSKCGIEGSLQTRNYETQDGTKKYITEVLVESVEFLSASSSKEDKPKTKLDPIDDEDLPF